MSLHAFRVPTFPFCTHIGNLYSFPWLILPAYFQHFISLTNDIIFVTETIILSNVFSFRFQKNYLEIQWLENILKIAGVYPRIYYLKVVSCPVLCNSIFMISSRFLLSSNLFSPENQEKLSFSSNIITTFLCLQAISGQCLPNLALSSSLPSSQAIVTWISIL